jgi:transposase InsO family protein
LDIFPRNKYEFFERFKEFKALVENQIEKIIKVLRIDNGREFCGNEFEELCKKCSIERQKTTPYTPQQNGFAERMNIDVDGKIKVHAQWCRVRERILGRGSGYCMLASQHITLISAR